jgi:hypothetical protein
MSRILAPLVPLLIGTAGSAIAQQPALDTPHAPAPLSASALAANAPIAPLLDAGHAGIRAAATPAQHLAGRLPAARAQARHGIGRTVLMTAGGSFLGAWVGYVASQVARSDWDKSEDGEFTGYRARFALGGGVAGGALGALLAHHSHAPRTVLAEHDEAGPARAGARGDALRPEEIASVNARDAYDLIAALRPTWLRARGQETFHDTPNGYTEGTGNNTTLVVTSEAAGGIKVYLDEAPLGGIPTLHDVAAAAVTGAEFIGPAEATYRWGSGVSQGVIRLSTRPM